jgi:hypothetical protein
VKAKYQQKRVSKSQQRVVGYREHLRKALKQQVLQCVDLMLASVEGAIAGGMYAHDAVLKQALRQASSSQGRRS